MYKLLYFCHDRRWPSSSAVWIILRTIVAGWVATKVAAFSTKVHMWSCGVVVCTCVHGEILYPCGEVQIEKQFHVKFDVVLLSYFHIMMLISYI